MPVENRGKQTVNLPNVLQDDLLKIHKERDLIKIEDGKYAIESPFVFFNFSGKPFESHSFSQAFTRVAEPGSIEWIAPSRSKAYCNHLYA